MLVPSVFKLSHELVILQMWHLDFMHFFAGKGWCTPLPPPYSKHSSTPMSPSYSKHSITPLPPPTVNVGALLCHPPTGNVQTLLCHPPTVNMLEHSYVTLLQ